MSDIVVIEVDLLTGEVNVEMGVGIPGPPGPGVAPGGTDGQYLVKDGATSYVTKWTSTVPGGGTDLDTLPTWPNDTEATKPVIDGGGGLSSGDKYWVSEDSDALPSGTLRRIP